MSIRKRLLFLKGAFPGHDIYVVPKGTKVSFSIVPLRVPEALRIPFVDCKDVLHGNADKGRQKKRSSRHH